MELTYAGNDPAELKGIIMSMFQQRADAPADVAEMLDEIRMPDRTSIERLTLLDRALRSLVAEKRLRLANGGLTDLPMPATIQFTHIFAPPYQAAGQS